MKEEYQKVCDEKERQLRRELGDVEAERGAGEEGCGERESSE